MRDMNEPQSPLSTRRDFIKSTSQVAAASALAGVALPYVHAAGSDELQIALIGCGGRGTGAAGNAMSQSGPPKLVAMADVFQHRLDGSYNALERTYKDRMDVPKERQFIGFDAYKNAMDCLKKGDIAIFTTPLAFRWVNFAYAIQKGLNVFMEKPLTADGPTSRRMIKLAEEASAKNLKCAVGLMSRHSRALQELQHRIQDGEIGDIVLMRGYRMQGPIGSAWSQKYPGPSDEPGKPKNELLWQISRFHSFIWLSGGAYSDFYIHHIDHLCMLKGAWPVKCQGIGGRHYRGTMVDQNMDNYSVEYTFADGTKMYMDGRHMPGCNDIYSSYVHGTKGYAIASKNGDCGLPSSTYKGLGPERENHIWTSDVKPAERDPYINEWYDFIEAIRADKPYNEVKRGVEASVATSMGRMSCHTGQEITFDQMLNHEHEYSPNTDQLTMDSPSPLAADAEGRYPIPEPGVKKNREF
jgi:predicted dehydrogenase